MLPLPASPPSPSSLPPLQLLPDNMLPVPADAAPKLRRWWR
jgi:hypothetical protein